MAIPQNIGQDVGLFVQTTNVWDDVARINTTDVNSPEFKELLVRLYQNINNIALVLNIKDSGYYVQSEFVNGQLFFPPIAPVSINQNFRQVYRKVINFGTLPNTATKSVAHEIVVNSSTSFTRIYATATDPIAFSFIPIPFTELLGNEISIDVDATNVNISTNVDRTNYTICYVVLEYLKQ